MTQIKKTFLTALVAIVLGAVLVTGSAFATMREAFAATYSTVVQVTYDNGFSVSNPSYTVTESEAGAFIEDTEMIGGMNFTKDGYLAITPAAGSALITNSNGATISFLHRTLNTHADAPGYTSDTTASESTQYERLLSVATAAGAEATINHGSIYFKPDAATDTDYTYFKDATLREKMITSDVKRV